MGCFDICGKQNKDEAADNHTIMANHPTGNADHYGKQVPDRMHSTVQAIPAKALRKITKNFSPKVCIAYGTCGGVYHGILTNGQVVSVKKLDTSKQSEEDFLAQVSKYSELDNEYVVRLLGYCVENALRSVTYELAPHGSLHDILHGRRDARGALSDPLQVLSWNARIKIAVGAAKGLEYLHEKCDPPIIHRNVKSSNVLVFDDFVTKLDDFDLSSQRSDSLISFYPCTGPFGHFQHYGTDSGPEVTITAGPTMKSNIHNFGVIMLEILTRRMLDDRDRILPRGHKSLVTWATPYLTKGKVCECIDSKLHGQYPPKAVAKFASVAAMCLELDSSIRPNISTVVQALQPLLDQSVD